MTSFEESWNKLKEHAKQQEGTYKKLGLAMGKHIWKDVQNKMWMLEKELKKGDYDAKAHQEMYP